MDSPTLLIIAGLFLVAAMGTLFIVETREKRRALVAARIASVVAVRTYDEPAAPAPEREGLDRRLSRLMRSLPANTGEKIEAAMATTGNTVRPVSLLVIGVVASIVSLFLSYFFNFAAPIAIGISIAAGYFVPLLHFRRKRTAYRTQFLEVFPDGLDLIARIVRAGVPVSTGIEVAGNESPEPVKSIFAEISSQNRVGISFEDSLMRMVKRLHIPDFSFFASALILQRESGGNIVETISNLSAIVRKRKELRKKGEALTAEARTVAGVLAALPFVGSALVALINYEYMALLFVDPRGNAIMGVALVMLVTGMAIMRGMVNKALR
ncbi:MAG: tight adherence protein [Aliidongia sp.]|jgi:Flp pilus assembly protein TadB|nr:tight adherence protein [Aliidongia sp.]